jgi:hypothetical protein
MSNTQRCTYQRLGKVGTFVVFLPHGSGIIGA